MIFFKKKKPILFIDGKNCEKQIEILESLNLPLTEEGNKQKESDLKALKYGLNGEKQIIYELLHSNIPMYILHDVYYEWENNTAQIDFIVITEYKIFIIECKNLKGNITINSEGSFIRNYDNIKEGIYSPISQNEKHIELLVNLIKSKQKGLNKLFNYNIQNHIVPIIAFTNPKTIIYKDYAPNNIKKYVMKAEAINNYIKTTINNREKIFDMESYAKFFEHYNKPVTTNYISKYTKYIMNNIPEPTEPSHSSILKIKKELIAFRKEQSKKERIEPYIIFTNEQLDNLIQTLPRTKEDLIKVRGFGEKKVEKYGDMIISIINSKNI